MRLERWRDARWAALEARAGALAARDPAQWYELLAFEGWCAESKATRLPPAALELFYRVKPLIPRSAQLRLRRLLAWRQRGPSFPAWPFESAGRELVEIAIADAALACGRSAVRFHGSGPTV